MRISNPLALVFTLVGVMAALATLGLMTPAEAGFGCVTAMALQSAYTDAMRPGLEGQVATMNLYDADTRICETAAGIGFGKAVSQGTADKGAVIGGALADFIGVTIRDITQDNADDEYKQNASMGVLTRGYIWVKPSVAVTAGDPVHYVSATGVFTNTGDIGPIVGARYETSAGADELAQISLK
jgi:hypothetical protein